jgi:phage repressor protein C with HTH and peptisase S24 domain
MDGNSLKIKLKNRNISLATIANSLKMSRQALNSKLNANELKMTFLTQIAESINTNVYDLINDESDNPSESVKGIFTEIPQTGDSKKAKEIPLLDIEAMAGEGNGEVSVLGYSLTGYKIPLFQDADFLIPVKGNSMWPKYNGGDIVACRKLDSDTFFQWNKVYVLDTEQGALIKRIRKSEKQDHLLIVSENKEYESFDLPTSKVRSIAMVLGRLSLE